MVGLGDLPDGIFDSGANDISADGTLIVGYAHSDDGREAVLWDEKRSIHRVVDVLADNGVTVPDGWTLEWTRGVAINYGVVTLTGFGTNPAGDQEAWITRYVTGPTVIIDENTTQTELDELVIVDGNIIIVGSPGDGCVSMPNLTQVTGSVFAYGVQGLSCIHMPAANVDTDVVVINNDVGIDITIGSAGAGDIIIDGTGGDITVDLGGDGGDIIIDGTDGDITVDLGGNVDGDIVIANTSGRDASDPRGVNTATVTLGSAIITGSVSITAGKPTTVTILVPVAIAGDLTIDNIEQPVLDLSDVSVVGFTSLASLGSDPVYATVAGTLTTLDVRHDTDGVNLFLPLLSATTGVAILIDRLGGTELPPETGFLSDGSEGILDPLSLYAVEVGSEDLAFPATLTLTLDLESLPPADALALATAIGEDRATLATGETAPPLAALPLCEGSKPAEGCTALRFLDAQGLPTSFELATTAEFSTLTTHLSEWAMVTIGCVENTDCDDGDDCTVDTCDSENPEAGSDGCVHEYQIQVYADIRQPYAPPSPPQPNLDDILCLLDDYIDGPAVDGCDCKGFRQTTDLDPCPEDGGGDGVIGMDDILFMLDAFSGQHPCPDPCP